MSELNAQEIRNRFLKFFEERGHAIIPSASLVPENDPSVLFTTAGMQPLVPYLLGEKHPQGTRLANFQKVVRTVDIDEVGDNTHLTFFEMMGNWSLGDYFKQEAISWSYELLTDKENGFGLDPSRLYVTCFEGDDNAPKDTESAEIWKSLGVPEERIYFMGADDNWWSPGENGPCGPDTEMFYDVVGGLNLTSKEEFIAADDKQQVVEIWNDVFMEYKKENGKVVGKLENKNVDTGSGFERVTTVIEEKSNVYETSIFAPIIEKITTLAVDDADDKAVKIIADHIRASVFLVGDGVLPANSDQGYILRRLIRRASRFAQSIGIADDQLQVIADTVIDVNGQNYTNLEEQRDHIKQVIAQEEAKFQSTLADGMKQFAKMVEKQGTISGEDAFTLYATYGFPIELTQELAQEKGIAVDLDAFETALGQHQEASRTASAGKFKGGLAGHGEMETKYHTATHLLHAALRAVLGDHVMQKGSNITADRLRFDFSHSDKMTDDEKQQVEAWINGAIEKGYAVTRSEMPFDEAKALGAIGLFEDKYGDVVSVYTVGNGDEVVSRELCGGPHVESIADLGTFRIKKEEASSAGVRRIKAVLE